MHKKFLKKAPTKSSNSSDGESDTSKTTPTPSKYRDSSRPEISASKTNLSKSVITMDQHISNQNSEDRLEIGNSQEMEDNEAQIVGDDNNTIPEAADAIAEDENTHNTASPHPETPVGAFAVNNMMQNSEHQKPDAQQEEEPSPQIEMSVNRNQQQCQDSGNINEGSKSHRSYQQQQYSQENPLDIYSNSQAAKINEVDQYAVNRNISTTVGGTRQRSLQSRQNHGQAYKTFKESDLLKAANIYSQFDKKGNLFENRLYAKTSINQVRLNKEQFVYDNRMESQPDEIARITNASITERAAEKQTSLQNSIERSIGNLDKQNSYQSAIRSQARGQESLNQKSLGQKSNSSFYFNGNTGGNRSQTKPQTAGAVGQRVDLMHDGGIQTNTMFSKFNITHGSVKGTFSQANKPRVTRQDHRSYDIMSQDSLYQRTNLFKHNLTMNEEVPQSIKNNVARSFKNVQRTFQKCQTLAGVRNQGWSTNDQNLKRITAGTGGANNTFRHAQNLVTNDASLYQLKGFNTTAQRCRTQKASKVYRYQNSDGSTIGIDLMIPNQVFRASQDMRYDGQVHYAKCLNDKGDSQVKIADSSSLPVAGFTNKIQKKAYRANTQSKQVDGIYRPDKFQNRAVFLNCTRSNYNIMNPYQNVDIDPIASKVFQLAPAKTMDAMKKGKCHQVYGISDFMQNGRLGGIKYHEKYQTAHGADKNTFRRVNGEFTNYGNQQKYNKF